MSRKEMERIGWDELDVLLVSGDAYVDHPSFGAALLGRLLVAHGFRTGIAAQPRWDRPDDVMRMGRPRLFAGVTAGALDSMLAHYTAFRKKRRDDAYTPGGRAGARPNRATITYTALARNAFPGARVVIGGIEASMRRAVHYDFWTNAIRRSILEDSKADLLVYGMGERAVANIASRLAATRSGNDDASIPKGIAGTVFLGDPATDIPAGAEVIALPSYEDILADHRELMKASLLAETQAHRGRAWAVQSTGKRFLVVAPPAAPLSETEMDAVYDLPFTGNPHPSYKEAIPAVEMIRFSITSHRGCAGGCSFCSLAMHQGRRIQSRSARSILAEALRMTAHPGWTGSVSNVGGPSANMWGASCRADPSRCRRQSCLWPEICPDFSVDQKAIAGLLSRVASVKGVKHVRTAGGVRHDLALADREYLRHLAGEFTGGQLTVAPEHISDKVLQLMRKPSFALFERFAGEFQALSRRAGKEQYLVPYLISAFPGCTDADMRRMAQWLKSKGWKPRQVQCFIPLPGTIASAMYFAGIAPDGAKLHVARTDAERLRQHRLFAGSP